MKARTYCTILAAVVLVVAANPVFGGLVHAQHSSQISPLIRPKVDCEGWGFLSALIELLYKIMDELEAGIQTTKETIGGPEDFDLAIENFRNFNEVELNQAFDLFIELANKYPWQCDNGLFVLHLFSVHTRTVVERAGTTLAAISFLKSPELYEVVKADMATRVAVVLQLIDDVDAVVNECLDAWC